MGIVEIMTASWPIVLGLVTLLIILAKMHGDIEVLKDKIKTLFDLWNNRKP